MRSCGAVIVAVGKLAEEEAGRCAESLRRSNPGLEMEILNANGADLRITRMDNGSAINRLSESNQVYSVAMTNTMRSRFLKVNLADLTPFERTLYLDADTRVQGDVSEGFGMLEDGWEMAMAVSENQEGEAMWHVGEEEKERTLVELGYLPLQMQAGVMFFRKCEEVKNFFEAWREEWTRWRGQDQAAFLRALGRAPVKVWLLGRPWNGGAVVQHLFGRCR